MSENKDSIEGEFIKKAKVRSTKYEPWMCEKIVEVAEGGGHVAQMCIAIGISSKDTFYRWINSYDDFKAAYSESKLHSQVFYENLLLLGATGRITNFNFNSVAMVMNNKFGDEYKRSASGGSNTEINIGSINSIEQLAGDALDDKIKQLQEKLGIEQDDEEEEQ